MGDNGQLPNLEPVLPKRDRRGRFAPGQSGNYNGRPREAFSEQCRAIAVKRKLAEMLGEVARGVGEFRETDVNTRIRAAGLLFSYAFGPPMVPVEAVDEMPPAQIIKRIFLDERLLSATACADI